MKCPNCKKEVAKGSVFCGYCGAKLPRRKLRITIMVIMLLLITIPLVYYKYNQTQQKREENRVVELSAAEDARLKAAANGYKYVDLGLPSGDYGINKAYCLNFSVDKRNVAITDQYYGQSIRPVVE